MDLRSAIVIGGFSLLLLIYAYQRLGERRRGETRSPHPPDWWRGSTAYWRAWERTDTVSALLALILVAALSLGLVTDETHGALWVLRLVLLGLFVVLIPLIFTTGIWGEPRQLVPRHVRNSPDLFTDLRVERRRDNGEI